MKYNFSNRVTHLWNLTSFVSGRSSLNLCTFLRSLVPDCSSGWSRSGTSFFPSPSPSPSSSSSSSSSCSPPSVSSSVFSSFVSLVLFFASTSFLSFLSLSFCLVSLVGFSSGFSPSFLSFSSFISSVLISFSSSASVFSVMESCEESVVSKLVFVSPWKNRIV